MKFKKNFYSAGIGFIMLALLSACSSDEESIRGNGDLDGTTISSGNNSDLIGGTNSGFETPSVEDLAGDEALRQTRVIYFDYDSAQVKEEYRDVLAAHARYLRANPQILARLEGHADERGSREYNLGLGQNRADSVRQFIRLTGVSGNQLDTISYGEEKPASFASGETNWSQNRRVEIQY